MLRRLARALVLKYPQPWLARYGDEVLELVADSPVRVSDIGELFRGLAVERARALIEDADHPRRTAAILGWTQPLFVLVFTCSAWATGAFLRTEHPLPVFVEDQGDAAGTLWLLAFWLVVLIRRLRQSKGLLARGPVFSPRTGLTLLPVVFLVVVFVEWCYVPGYASRVHSPTFDYWMYVVRNVLYQGFAVGLLSASFMPGRLLLQALVELSWSDGRIASAQTWVEGCRTMIARGVPSPLDEAQANVDRLCVERDEVTARLSSLGYGARFRK